MIVRARGVSDVTWTNMAEIQQRGTYEVVLEVSVHVVNAVIHDTCSDALACEAERPRRLNVQIKLRNAASLACVVLRSTRHVGYTMRRKTQLMQYYMPVKVNLYCHI